MRKTASLKKDNAYKEKTGGKRGKQKFRQPSMRATGTGFC